VEFDFDAEIIEWRGPAPYLFAPLPADAAHEIAAAATLLSYGWGCIPATGRIGETDFTTSLFPRDGGYLMPVKAAVQRTETVGLGDVIHVQLTVGDD